MAAVRMLPIRKPPKPLCVKWKHALQLKPEEGKPAGVSGSSSAAFRWGFGCFQGEVISARASLHRDLAAVGLP